MKEQIELICRRYALSETAAVDMVYRLARVNCHSFGRTAAMLLNLQRC